MTAVRALWLGLAVLGAAWSLLFGVPLWLSFAALSCAITPPAAGIFLSGSAKKQEIAEIETGLWVAAATAAAASTGGAVSPLNILYAIPIGLAWMTGSGRLTAETTAFALLGYVLAAVAGSGGSWIPADHAVTLSMSYGACGLAMAGLIAAFSAAGGQGGNAVATVANADPAAGAKLREAESRAAAAERQVAALKAEAQAARTSLAARTRFFAQTSHELRTPLNVIIGFAEMMRNAVFGPLPDRYKEYAELIHEGGKGLSVVVDDVLDLSHIEAGKFEIKPELIGLTDVAAEAVRFMSDMAARKKIELALDDGEDAEAYADARAVKQIALNLISNALKFTPEGGTVTVACLETAGGALLAVSDTGAGISEDELQKLSREFEQGTEGRKQKGTGLGLSVVRAFAELHGGRLDIESREGGGSTIAVFFPEEKRGT